MKIGRPELLCYAVTKVLEKKVAGNKKDNSKQKKIKEYVHKEVLQNLRPTKMNIEY